ncbi:MAG: hypothetical protein LH610_11995 [Sphingomonas bacterium]|nr:hypothetical protein [Sphingomonas bacterium]
MEQLVQVNPRLGDSGSDADWFRDALVERGITPCVPSKTNRNMPIPRDRDRGTRNG